MFRLWNNLRTCLVDPSDREQHQTWQFFRLSGNQENSVSFQLESHESSLNVMFTKAARIARKAHEEGNVLHSRTAEFGQC